MSRTWGLCNSENLLNLSAETAEIKSTQWIWKQQWEGWPWPWFCHSHLHTVAVPAVLDIMAGESTALSVRHQSAKHKPAAWFQWFLGTQLHIAPALHPVLSVGSSLTTVGTLLQKLQHQRLCWQLRIHVWVLFCAGRKAPKTGESTELNVSVQHFSPPDLTMLSWQRVKSGVNPVERIFLQWWLGGDTSGSAHIVWHTGHFCPLGLLTCPK